MGPRVLIIKLGALGDVVRTGSILPGLIQLTGELPHVSWVTSAAGVELVTRMPGVDRVLPYNEETITRLRVERFDLLISLDKEPGPCALAMAVQADRKLGIGLSRYGTPFPLNELADYYFELGLNNEEKFHRNQKSYQELVYDALGMEYTGQPFDISLTEADLVAANRRFEGFDLNGSKTRWIGINPGAGGVFAYKAWREAGYVGLIRGLTEKYAGLRFLLLGGPGEESLLQRMMGQLEGLPVYSGGTSNTLGEFTALIDRCELLICGDTLAMHLAIARRKRVVAMFGPTAAQEIDLFDRGSKIKSSIECSPCYRRNCVKNPTCQDLISEQEVLQAAVQQLEDQEKEGTQAPQTG